MPLNGELHVVTDVGAAFADMVQEEFASRPRRDDFVIALGGGSTAAACYEALAATNIGWEIVTIIWGDERMVPPDHEDSNYLIAKNTLLDKVGPFKAVYRMDMDRGAESYEEIVRDVLPIDVVHLGMGPDGHTLSLFPGSPALHEDHRLVIETGDDKHPHPRMTLTYPAMTHVRNAIFTIVGAGKLEMFQKVEAGEGLPATHLKSDRVVWLADAPAVGRD